MNSTEPSPNDSKCQAELPYARAARRQWTRFEALLAAACSLNGMLLSCSTIDILFRIPGERYPLSPDTTFDFVGLVCALVSFVLLVIALRVRNTVIVYASVGLVLLSIVWGGRFVVLLFGL